MALKVNDLRFEIYGLHWLNGAIFRVYIGCLGLLFELLEKKMTLKVNSDYRFEFYGLCSMC